MDNPTIEKPLNAQQLSQVIPIHSVTLLRWAREARIPHRRLSPRKILFMPSEINRWLASGETMYPTDAVRVASTHESEAA